MKYPLTCLQGSNNLAFVSAPLRPFAGDTAVGTGTGFFFQPVFERIFLITNRHMVIDESDQFFPDHLVLKLHTDPVDLTICEQLRSRPAPDSREGRGGWNCTSEQIPCDLPG